MSYLYYKLHNLSVRFNILRGRGARRTWDKRSGKTSDVLPYFVRRNSEYFIFSLNYCFSVLYICVGEQHIRKGYACKSSMYFLLSFMLVNVSLQAFYFFSCFMTLISAGCFVQNIMLSASLFPSSYWHWSENSFSALKILCSVQMFFK